MRIVLDINVLVSGIISKEGPPGQLLSLWRERQYILIASEAQIERMRDVLSRPRLEPFIEQVEAEAIIADILDAAVIVEPDPSIKTSSDPEDNVILATAVAGEANLLVTGDKKHLLPLGDIQGIPILEPNEAIKRLRHAADS